MGKALARWRSSLSQWWRSQRPEPTGSGSAAAGISLSVLRAGLGRTRDWIGQLVGAIPGGVRPWVTLASLGFVMAVLIANGHELRQLQPDGQGALWLTLATGLTLASLVVNGIALAGVLAWLGGRPRWEATVSLFVSTNLRKYLPGGIWHLAARVEALRGAESPVTPPLSGGEALLVTLLEPMLAATAAMLLVAAGGWQNGLGLLAVLPLSLLMPGRLRRLLPALERRRAQELELDGDLVAEDEVARPLPGYPWPPLLLELQFVLLRFAGFACCVWAFDLQGIIPWTTWLAGFALAWTAGLVVPGAPGGLGVFETVLLLRLRVALPDAQLLAVALSYRLISTLADLFGAGLVEADQRLPLLPQQLGGWLLRVLPTARGSLRSNPDTTETRIEAHEDAPRPERRADSTHALADNTDQRSNVEPKLSAAPSLQPSQFPRVWRFLRSTWRRP
ncbi:MAG: UPF0104 family protein [Synechococcaceae cyanobacterium]|nr:UPF0104 family protein [Synechococcaceae cyanobacterium]